VAFIFARERAFGGGVARDFEGAGLGMLAGERGAPFVVGPGDVENHDEQLRGRVSAQSGGKPAQAAWPGRSS